MVKEPSLMIVEEMAEGMSLERLYEQYDKTNNPKVKQRVKEVIERRRKCPECGNDMMVDETEEVLYCPIGCFEIGKEQ
jgi:ribosomal protein S27AE